jgi:3'-phosphoadenosine 5'-phosphosulfate sulfotransferase (PAPS reductase)/FAD synthetase
MNPFLITEPTVISFSGGRTSAYMLWRVLEANGGLPEDALVVFANTGKEEEATLQFVHDCEKNWGCEIHWLEFQVEDPKFRRVTFETASRNGEPFEALIRQRKYLPNPVTRFCTAELKIRTIHKYVKSLGWDHHNETMDWVGIRADEMRRASKMDRSRTPLVTAGVTAKDVGEFWANNSFDLGLPNINGKTMYGNCDLCYLKAGNQVLSLIREKPERAVWWARMEEEITTFGGTKGDGDRFRMDRPSYAQMAKFSRDQRDLFTDETIPCYCGD